MPVMPFFFVNNQVKLKLKYETHGLHVNYNDARQDVANKISDILYTDKPLPFPCSGKKIILMAHIMLGMRCRTGKLAESFPV